MSLVRENLLTQKGYTPYCGDPDCVLGMPRSYYDGEQFACPCGWRSQFPEEFLVKYRKLIGQSNLAANSSADGS